MQKKFLLLLRILQTKASMWEMVFTARSKDAEHTIYQTEYYVLKTIKLP